MKQQFIIAVVAINFVTSTTPSRLTDLYYWKEYNGTVPNDAFVAGSVCNKNIYIGTGLYYDHGVILSTLFNGDKIAYSGMGTQEFQTVKQVKILCSSYPENLFWKPIRIGTIFTDVNPCQLVDGGDEKVGSTMYIGRLNIKGDNAIAKVFPTTKTIHAFFNGKNFYTNQTEVLAACF